MPFILSVADEKDAEELMYCQYASFDLNHPFYDILWPGQPTPDNIKAQAKRRLSYMEDSMTYLKVVDTETGKIVGAGEWCFHPNGKERERWMVDWYGEKESPARQWSQFVIDETMSRRDRYIHGPHALIDMCFVHPDYNRKGIGKQIMHWGLERADQLGLPVYVEASFEGQPLYEYSGFRVKEHVKLHDEQWSRRPVIEYLFMERPARSVKN